MTRGILIISCGKNHDAMAVRLINSLMKVGCNLPIHIHRESLIGRWSRGAKVRMCEISPFDATLYLDCDMLALRNPESLLNLLTMPGGRKFKVYACEDTAAQYAFDMVKHPFYKKELSKATMTKLSTTVAADAVHWNTGLIAFHKDAWPLFTAWEQSWRDATNPAGMPELDEPHFMFACSRLGLDPGPLVAKTSVPCNPEKSDEWVADQMRNAVMLHLCGENKRSSYERITRLLRPPHAPRTAPAPPSVEGKGLIAHASTSTTMDSSEAQF